MALAISTGYLTLMWLNQSWGSERGWHRSAAESANLWRLWLSAATVAISLLTGLLLTAMLSGRLHRHRLALTAAGVLALWMVLVTVAHAAQPSDGTTHLGMCLSYPMEPGCG